MKTRYSSLVHVKKNIMQKSERVLQSANSKLKSAQTALQLSFNSLNDIVTPQSGLMPEFLASRTLLDAGRTLIKHNEEWVAFTQEEIGHATLQLRLDTIEFEKYKYLETQEIKKILKKIKLQEAKDLDEVALMTYKNINKSETL